MCVVIFAGKKRNALWETGLDLDAETFGDPSDPDYFQKTPERGNDSSADQHVISVERTYRAFVSGLSLVV